MRILWFSSSLGLLCDVLSVLKSFQVTTECRFCHSRSATELGNGKLFAAGGQLLKQFELSLCRLKAKSPGSISGLLLA